MATWQQLGCSTEDLQHQRLKWTSWCVGGSFLRHFEILSWRYFDGEDNVDSYKVPQINPVKDYIKRFRGWKRCLGNVWGLWKSTLKCEETQDWTQRCELGLSLEPEHASFLERKSENPLFSGTSAFTAYKCIYVHKMWNGKPCAYRSFLGKAWKTMGSQPKSNLHHFTVGYHCQPVQPTLGGIQERLCSAKLLSIKLLLRVYIYI